jgi:hypothetical protein
MEDCILLPVFKSWYALGILCLTSVCHALNHTAGSPGKDLNHSPKLNCVTVSCNTWLNRWHEIELFFDRNCSVFISLWCSEHDTSPTMYAKPIWRYWILLLSRGVTFLPLTAVHVSIVFPLFQTTANIPQLSDADSGSCCFLY